jgi:hypothetical protein
MSSSQGRTPPPPPGRLKGFVKKLFTKDNLKALGIATGALVALATLTGTLATLYVARRSANTADQGLVTERFKDGVDELGSSDENVQAGGMFILARVARDSPPDAATAYEVILFFVRGHLCQNKVQKDAKPGPPQSVTAGLQILHHAKRYINLTRLQCGTYPADLSGADLSGVDLSYANLSGASLQRAKLNGARLNCATLLTTDFTHGANVGDVKFTGADISDAGFQGSTGLTRRQLRAAHWDDRHPPGVDPGKKSWITHPAKNCAT